METGENNTKTIKSDRFNTLELASKCHLSIQVGKYHLAYCILNIDNFNYEYFKEYKFSSENNSEKITKIISNDNYIKNGFISVTIAYINNNCTLVPKILYSEDICEDLLGFNICHEGLIMSDYINNQEAYLIYSVPSNIKDVLLNYFPNAKEFSQESILISEYYNLDNNYNKVIYLYLNENTATITHFNNKKLLFNNKFNYKTKEDLLYYILYSYEQLKLSVDEVNIIIHGDIEENDIYYNLIYDYIRNVTLLKKPKNISCTKEFSNLKEHKYFGLFNQILCV